MHSPSSPARRVQMALLGLLLLGAGAAQADQLDTILAAKKLRVAIDLAVPPYSMKDDKLRLIGSDVETAQRMAKDFGLELEVVPTTLTNRVPYLQTNKADIVISAFSITPERAKVIDFSVPYAPILVVVGAPRSMKITSPADLAGKKIIATRGTTNDQELTKIAPSSATITRFDDDATSMTAMVSGQADIWATSPMLLKVVNQKNPSRDIESKLTLKANLLAVGLRKGEPRLKEKIDGWIRTNLSNGELNTIYKKYHEAELPPEILHPAS
ncbi:transporter substrate-binding domain-containing protein [Herbaspirillum seropedicae]|uniref:ABC-type amino acid transport/signal transduction systems, periplasmic binding protein n=1 Tax=Herbaspirillum seropedicae (strain SmR1) TaxID=757424 RepID=D8IV47_HERSS|nr:transporter substrate-binding domain-containing protein [Herbaspirillum seropedicae]ADJ61766.1 ABC-type amino acid transport/signal transduction systems, periplasmic binding protein [Herbaspirillum seropedicae SmR1]AKN63963.1 amino acid ABC transporter [Herbaspirillum seropedicae]NQE29339.1 amino acid ABC transporter [Herbaspirillum seropedicae]QDD62882.1 transporter substrate-binding domain-containing protein [Herbaspirillum seropedicae]UMU19878.1 transporter substrate-binding domain-conta